VVPVNDIQQKHFVFSHSFKLSFILGSPCGNPNFLPRPGIISRTITKCFSAFFILFSFISLCQCTITVSSLHAVPSRPCLTLLPWRVPALCPNCCVCDQNVHQHWPQPNSLRSWGATDIKAYASVLSWNDVAIRRSVIVEITSAIFCVSHIHPLFCSGTNLENQIKWIKLLPEHVSASTCFPHELHFTS